MHVWISFRLFLPTDPRTPPYSRSPAEIRLRSNKQVFSCLNNSLDCLLFYALLGIIFLFNTLFKLIMQSLYIAQKRKRTKENFLTCISELLRRNLHSRNFLCVNSEQATCVPQTIQEKPWDWTLSFCLMIETWVGCEFV